MASRWQIVCADVLDWAKNYNGEKAHAILCDPPYSLNFMNQKWDDDIAFRKDTWAALAAHLLPGAFGMALASARGWHRLAVAIEDAGLRIHPSIFGWAYGSGFPKATRIDTQVDKAAGAEREVVGRRKRNGGPTKMLPERGWNANPGGFERDDGYVDVECPATPLAQAWKGHRYGLQAMKPALEPIIVFQKPYRGKPVDSITETGAGALNIDGARIGLDSKANLSAVQVNFDAMGYHGADRTTGILTYNPQGRWPANFCLTHHPECRRVGTKRVRPAGGDIIAGSKGAGPRENEIYGKDSRPRGEWTAYKDPDGLETVASWRCHPDCPIAKMDRQAGNAGGGDPRRADESKGGKSFHGYDHDHRKCGHEGFNDKGGPSRFFHQSGWSYEVAEQLAAADPVRYCPKSSKSEREAGLDDLPDRTRNCTNPGGMERDPKWKPVQRKNHHPTCKPISLNEHLAVLLCPPPEYAPRRVLIPFAGVASEGIGALLAGWDEIVMIEMIEEYCTIGEARMQYYASLPEQLALRL